MAPPRSVETQGGAVTSERETAELQNLVKSSPDIAKLAGILKQRQEEQRKALLALQDARGKLSGQQRKALAARMADGIAERRKALGLLSQPYTPTYQVLETPFLIWQTPQIEPNVFLNSNITAGSSWVKVFFDAYSGGDQTNFNFYFLWSNPADYYVVANVSSPLFFSGTAGAWGSGGILSGNTASIVVTQYLTVVRWTGWGNDPVTGQSYNQTPYPGYYAANNPQNVVELSAYGGDWFHDATPKNQTFDPTMPYEAAADFVAIPGGAVTLFEVGFHVGYAFSDGGQLDDGVQLDLSNDNKNHMVTCPMLELELLTPLVATGGTGRTNA
jgi:hypothetical protein